MKQILLACTGNTCRSPMGQRILQARLDELAPGSFQVHSAGIAAVYGEPASLHAVRAMEEIGLDLSDHESRPVRETDIHEMDLILTMTEYHSRHLVRRFPEAGSRIFTIGEYIGRSKAEIEDPIGGPLSEYRYCRQQLEELLNQVAGRLIAQSADPGVG